MVCAQLRAKTTVCAESAPEKSDVSTQTQLVRKGISVQVVSCDECPDNSSGGKASTCTKSAKVEDLLWQLAELQETVHRLRSIRGAEIEIYRASQPCTYRGRC